MCSVGCGGRPFEHTSSGRRMGCLRSIHSHESCRFPETCNCIESILPRDLGHPLREQLGPTCTPSTDRLRGLIYTAQQGAIMSIARIVEISSTSDKSFENALEQGIARASKTLRGIKSAWVKEQEVQVEGDKI